MSDIEVKVCEPPKVLVDVSEPPQILVDVCTGPTGPTGPPGPPAAVLEWNYYPAAGQTTLTGSDASGLGPMVFNPDSVQVFGNGVMLERVKDYALIGEDTVELTQPALGSGDVYTVMSQVTPIDYDPTQDTLNLQAQANENTDAIASLDARVAKNEADIASLQQLLAQRSSDSDDIQLPGNEKSQ